MAKKRQGTTTHREAAVEQPALEWRTIGMIVVVAIAVQALLWIVMVEAFAIGHLGYGFWDLSDLAGVYQPYAVNLSRGMVAYRDFFIEYPPLFVPLLMAAGDPTPIQYFVVRFAAMMVGFMMASGVIVGMWWMGRRERWRPYVSIGLFGALTLLLGTVAANRYDAAVAFTIVLAAYLMLRRQWEWAAVAMGIGFALKVTPAMMLPLIFLLAPVKRSIRSAVAFAVAGTLPFLWALSAGGSTATVMGEMLRYHLTRPLEMESLLATPLWIGHLAGVTKIVIDTAAGSQVIQTPAGNAVASISSVALLAALGTVFWLVWRRRERIAKDPTLLGLACVATMLAAFLGSKVFSPQYLIWLLPLLSLIALDRKLLAGVLAAAVLLTQIVFPANYMALAFELATGPVIVLVLRNILVLVALGIALWELWRLPEKA